MASTLAADATVDDLHTLTGQRWPWLFTRGADLLAADTPTEICQLLIDDYHQIPAGIDGDRDALLARWGYTCGLAQQLQETLAGLACNRDLWQPGDPAHHAGTLAGMDTDAGVEEILLGDRSQPVDQVADWQHPVPLILCTLDYAPHTLRTPPGGNIVWLDPYTETSLLHSLTTAGLGRLYSHDQSDLDDEPAAG